MGDWRLIVTDLGGNVSDLSPGGELLQARDRRLTFPLNAVKSLAFTIDLYDPNATPILEHKALVKAYRKGVLKFVGPVVSTEEAASGDQGTIAVVCADPFWRLTGRRVGTSVDGNGKGVGYAQGTPAAPVDTGQIAKSLIDLVNTVPNATDGDTGIQVGAIQASVSSWVGPWYFKEVAEAIGEMSAALGGFDWEVVPLEPVGAWPNTKIGEFRAYTAKGVTRDEVIFEYGFGARNMVGYRRPTSSEQYAVKVWSLPSGFPDSAAAGEVPVAATGTVTEIRERGFREDVLTDDLSVLDFRQRLVNEHLRLRKVPREQIVFDVSPGLEFPEPFVDYDGGDVVTGRAKVRGSDRFEGTFRIYEIGAEPDELGTEKVDLRLVADS